MARLMKRNLIIAGVVTTLLSLAAFKVFYLGISQFSIGHVGSYEIVACKTWHSLGSVISNDARGGFYRVYDSEGEKVFELFSDAFSFDVVLTSEQQIEFQLDSGEIKFWTRPD